MTTKKLFIEIFGWILVTALVFGFFHAYNLITNDSYKLKPGEKFQEVSGRSMGEKFPDGVNIINTLANPIIGDVISFVCLSEKCYNPDNDGQVVVHRITAIEPNGCMHIEGDNPLDLESWDTNDYGCLMPDEIKILGVVIDK